MIDANRSLILRVDLNGVVDKASLLSRVACGLCFPSSYGSNYDALAEGLSDLDWILIGSSGGGWIEHPDRLVVVFSGVKSVSEIIPQDMKILMDLAYESMEYFNEQYNKNGRKLALLFCD